MISDDSPSKIDEIPLSARIFLCHTCDRIMRSGSSMAHERIGRVEPCVVEKEQQAFDVLRSELRQSVSRHESNADLISTSRIRRRRVFFQFGSF